MHKKYKKHIYFLNNFVFVWVKVASASKTAWASNPNGASESFTTTIKPKIYTINEKKQSIGYLMTAAGRSQQRTSRPLSSTSIILSGRRILILKTTSLSLPLNFGLIHYWLTSHSRFRSTLYISNLATCGWCEKVVFEPFSD